MHVAQYVETEVAIASVFIYTMFVEQQAEDQTQEMRGYAHSISAALWVLDNEFINENQKPFEFDSHRYMLQPYNDCSPDQVIMKSAQVGWSVLAILKSIHAANFVKLNVIYVLPTRNVVHDFVIPKVNPMIDRNPVIRNMVAGSDSTSLKQIGDRFVYFRGAFHRGEAISTTADLVVADEYDVSDQGVLTVYQSRLQASEFGWFWRFSNPTIPGFGVHELWQESDQMHWFIKCHHCGHAWYIALERDDAEGNHYVDEERVIYACGKCHQELSNTDRQNGRWVAKHPELGPKVEHGENVGRRGYWLSQMIVPWVSARKILQQKKDMDIETFHNFVLGLPYQASEFMLNEEAFKRACHPGLADKTDVIIGCDSGKTKHYVIGNMDGIFNYGSTTEWSDIETLINMFNATAVIDALPDFTVPEQLARKYPGRVFVHYYTHDSKSIDVVNRKEGAEFGVLQSDRTKLFDMLAGEIAAQKVRFYQQFTELKGKEGKGLIYHAGNIYRIIVTDPKGIQRARWEKKENKPDHWAHALAYWRVGKSQMLTTNEVGGVRPSGNVPQKTAPRVRPDGTVPVAEAMGIDLDNLIEKSLARHRKKKIS